MRFGLYFQTPGTEGSPIARRYEDTIEEIVLGEELGFHTAWLAELHFSTDFSPMPAPLMIAVAAAQRTRRIRLGIAVNQITLHHPFQMAEQGATADILTGGRLEFGIGGHRGGQDRAGFGIPAEDNRDRFEEALHLIKQAWTQEQVTYRGKYWDVDGVSVVPKPLQRPHPPLRIAANSNDTYRDAARLGLPVFSTVLNQPMPGIVERMKEYRAAQAEHGYPLQEDMHLMLPLFVAETAEEAREVPRESYQHYQGNLAANIQVRASGETGEFSRVRSWEQDHHSKWEYSRVLEQVVFDDPDGCVNRLQELHERTGFTECICWFNQSSIPHERVMQAMRLFAEAVMPQLNTAPVAR